MRRLLIAVAACGLFFIVKPALAANGTISGTVTHAVDGTPVVGIWLSATNISTSATTYVYGTGADGSYSLSLAPGTYDVSTYTSTSEEPGMQFIRKTITITLADSEVRPGQNFSLNRRGWFIGTVYSSDGVTPVAGAAITASNASGYLSGYGSTISTSTGSYVLAPAPTDTTASATGSYNFTITKSGYFAAQITGVALSANDAAVTRNVTLTPASTISGTITDSNGAVLADATVTLTRTVGSQTGLAYAAVTDVSGNYSVSIFDNYYYNGTAIGEYSISVSKSGYVSRSGTVSIDADASAVSGKNFAMKLGKTYSGSVLVKSDNAALASATVNLYKRNKARSEVPDYIATTDSSGAFSITGIASGNYRVRVTRNKYVNIVTDLLSIKKDISGAVYKMEAGGTISGQVYTGNRVGVDGASIGVYALKNGKQVSYTSVLADDQGNYTVSSLKAGTYRLRISSTDNVTQLANVAVKVGRTSTKNIKMVAAGSISGFLTDRETGLPVGYTIVRVVGTAITGISDINGYYVIDGIAPGRRKISVMSYYYDITSWSNITVRSGKITSGINFALNPKQ
ncbi:carboxypeptidase regulatory-like domain-containing protein [Candidatus Parcubacteria bacterium]|jgi:hypothetical protein|nr:MAG: carboxypeptidase regulatory-like domain-containing protein [Candidatus Parcubacteria bacterium]